MRKQHIVIEASECPPGSLTDAQIISRFLKSVSEMTLANALTEPMIAIRRKGTIGITGVLITESSHIAVHTFAQTREMTIELLSYNKFDAFALRDAAIKYFKISPDYMKLINVESAPEDRVECEEPGCSAPAKRVWKGRKICQDHYEYYSDREYKTTGVNADLTRL